MALTANRKTPEALPKPQNDPVAAAVYIYRGALCVLDSSGNLKPGVAATGLVARGVATKEVDNSAGLAGDVYCETKQGIFGFLNKSGDEVTAAEIGDVCYISTDAEVCKTSTSKSVAGVVMFIENSLVYVAVGLWPLQVGLLAANNLSDVGTAATARANIGANSIAFTFPVSSLVGSGALRAGFNAPFAFTITKIKSVLLGHALATGNATLTGKIAGTAITNGVITITQAGSAIGDLDTCSPSALNVVAADQFVEVLVGGTNDDADATAMVTVYGTY